MMVDKDDQRLTELLSAYLDGELTDEELAFVERTLDSDDTARRLLDELRRTVAVVGNLPKRSAPVTLTEDIGAQLERRALLGDTGTVTPAATAGSRSSWSTLLSMAAALAIICTGVVWYTYNPTGGNLPVVQDRVARNENVVSAPGAKPSGHRGKGIPVPPAVPAGRQIDEDAWMAAADVTRLVAVDAKMSHLRAHRFKNEDIKLTIAARDGADAKTLAQRLVSTLRSESVVDAAPSKDETPLRKLASRGFFLKGRPGVNYEGPAGEQQVLVRLSRRDRDRLFADMEQWSGIEGRAVLQSGPVRVSGLESSRLALAGTERGGPTPTERAQPGSAEGAAEMWGKEAETSEGDTEPVHPGVGLNVLAELAKVLAPSPEVKKADLDASKETPPSDLRDDTLIAAKSTGVAEPAADAIGTPATDDTAVGLVDAAGKSRASSGKPKSLVEKKMAELAPDRVRRARRTPSRAIMPGPTVGEAVASADKGTVDFVPDDAAAPDDFVTVVFRFIPPKLLEARPPKPEAPGGTDTKDKPAKKIDSIRK